MQTRYFALVYGIVFLIVGICGFIPGLTMMSPEGESLAVSAGFGYLFGLFAVNVLHNIVHLIFGVWGIAAYRSWSASRMYAKSVAVIYAVLTVMGFIPVLNTTFGLIPLWGNDIWLHAVLAAVAAYFGWFAPAYGTEAERARTTTTR